MSQKLDTIAIVEDEDFYYWKMLLFLSELNIPIQRFVSMRSALQFGKLTKQTKHNVFWIIDGNFPKFDNEWIETMWPSLIRNMEDYEISYAGMVWFTSDPRIFVWIDVLVFKKLYFTKSMWNIVELILKAHKS